MLNFTRTPRAEILSHMVDDLKFAADHLPANPDAVKPGKPTSGLPFIFSPRFTSVRRTMTMPVRLPRM